MRSARFPGQQNTRSCNRAQETACARPAPVVGKKSPRLQVSIGSAVARMAYDAHARKLFQRILVLFEEDMDD